MRIKEGGRSGIGGGKGQRVRNGLVVAEVALAFGLVSGRGINASEFPETSGDRYRS